MSTFTRLLLTSFLLLAASTAAIGYVVSTGSSPGPTEVPAATSTSPVATPDPQATDFAECADPASVEACITDRLISALDEDGVEAALGVFDEVAASNPIAAANCHQWMHLLGRETSEGLNWTEASEVFDVRCQGGFLHGMLQGYALASSTPEMKEIVADFCGPEPTTATDVELNVHSECIHGVGHAAAVHLTTDIAEAVSWCDGFTSSWATVCSGGVLMEFGENYQIETGFLAQANHGLTSSDDDVLPTSLTADERGNLCSLFSDVHDQECASRLWMFSGPDFADDWTGLARHCVEVVPGSEWDCGRTLGNWIPRYTAFNPIGPEPQRTEDMEVLIDGCLGLAVISDEVAAGCFYNTVLGMWPQLLTGGIPEAELPQLCETLTGEMEQGCRQGEEQARRRA